MSIVRQLTETNPIFPFRRPVQVCHVRNAGWANHGWVTGFCITAMSRRWIDRFHVMRQAWRLRWDYTLVGGAHCYDDGGYDHVEGCRRAIEDGLGRKK